MHYAEVLLKFTVLSKESCLISQSFVTQLLDRPPPSLAFFCILFLAPVSGADVCKAVNRLKPSNLETNEIAGFIIKGCSTIFIPILGHIFNLSLTHQYFAAAWKEAVVVPVFKRGNHAAMSNCRPISILNSFSKLFEFVIHDHG
jgi:hypothetical protein